MIGVIGVIISLGLLMFLAYKGISVFILAPLLALFATLLSGGTSLMATYTEIFMSSFGGFAKLYFPVFMLGALFGKVMEDSGAAKSIALFITKKLGSDKAVLAVVLTCAILAYGGVSVFVVVFAVYPVAVALFREANVPKRFMPASIALGSFTFAMTALPGTPQIQNAIPMPFFGTDLWAAPIIGLIGGLVMFFGGMAWLNYRTKKAMAAGEGYGDHKEDVANISDDKLPNFTLALIPIILVLLLNLVIGKYLAGIDGSFLQEYGTTLGKVKGIWSLIIAVTIAIIFALIIFRKNLLEMKKTVNKGVMGSLLPIANTASEVGYGNVIKSLAAFVIIKTAILAIPGNPLFSLAASTSILAGITGSASGGMSIALGALGDVYMQKALDLGMNPAVFHKIASMACGGLDSLPHNGAIITLLGITGMTHKESYADIGMCTVVIPLIATVIGILFAIIGLV